MAGAKEVLDGLLGWECRDEDFTAAIAAYLNSLLDKMPTQGRFASYTLSTDETMLNLSNLI
jgi:hypothetical protein